MRSTTSGLLGAVASILAACGPVAGDCDETASCDSRVSVPDAAARARTSSAQADAGAPSPDAGPDAHASGDMPASDAAAPDVAPPPSCETRVADPAAGVFVALAGIDGAQCGSKAAPCATMGAALVQAKAAALPNVYVAPGTYAASVELPAGVTIEGGWLADTWLPDCGAATPAAVLEGSAAGATILAKDIGGSARLRYLSVRSRPHSALSAGESAYGVIASGETTHLELDHADITSASAADGGKGGSPHAAGLRTGTCQTPGSGQDSNDVGAAGATRPASFTSAGYVTGDGATGAPGASGDNGLLGPVGACQAGFVNACIWVGLGPGHTCAFGARAMQEVCGAPGLPGCGGLPGAGGSGGQGGGASIALYVWRADVTVHGGKIVAGDAGSGGPGGAGGQGGLGSQGQAAAPAYLASDSCGMATTAEACVAFNRAIPVQGGAAGTAGARGAPGGKGGGGSGGSSFAIFHAGAPALAVQGAAVVAGSPGLGADGAPNGLSTPLWDGL